MEIAAGKLKGASLRAPQGMNTRPTAIRARQALFDMLGDLSGKNAADLFAGSGALGIEALSRGAAFCSFAEGAPAAVRCLRGNLTKMKKISPDLEFEIAQGMLPQSMPLLSSLPKPQYVFADPPYAQSMDLLAALLADKKFTDWCSDAVVVWERPADCFMRLPPPEWELFMKRAFGGADFVFFRRKPAK